MNRQTGAHPFVEHPCVNRQIWAAPGDAGDPTLPRHCVQSARCRPLRPVEPLGAGCYCAALLGGDHLAGRLKS